MPNTKIKIENGVMVIRTTDDRTMSDTSLAWDELVKQFCVREIYWFYGNSKIEYGFYSVSMKSPMWREVIDTYATHPKGRSRIEAKLEQLLTLERDRHEH